MLFDKMPQKDTVSWNAMLSGYAQNGYVDEARAIFDRMPSKNSISWNGILAAYVGNGRIEDARKLFELKSSWELGCDFLELFDGWVRKEEEIA